MTLEDRAGDLRRAGGLWATATSVMPVARFLRQGLAEQQRGRKAQPRAASPRHLQRPQVSRGCASEVRALVPKGVSLPPQQPASLFASRGAEEKVGRCGVEPVARVQWRHRPNSAGEVGDVLEGVWSSSPSRPVKPHRSSPLGSSGSPAAASSVSPGENTSAGTGTDRARAVGDAGGPPWRRGLGAESPVRVGLCWAAGPLRSVLE